jgi:hypothetical protein
MFILIHLFEEHIPLRKAQCTPLPAIVRGVKEEMSHQVRHDLPINKTRSFTFVQDDGIYLNAAHSLNQG